jgi:predicted type IV restriction endonuclease
MDQSELEDYVDVSESLIESSPQMDEQNTRRKLVEPFIELLGWDIVSPEVELEYSVQMGSGTKKVDYALLLEETPVVFVEAKGCDSSISESNRRQLRSYMRQTGIDWGLLTNGTTFELFKRRTSSSQPDETSLGAFSLEELVEYRNVLRAISRKSIKSGEAQNIAEHIEAAQQAAETLKNRKDGLAADITQLLIKEVGETVSQTVEVETKQYLDSLVAALRERGKAEVSSGSSNVRDTANGDGSLSTGGDGSWNPGQGANSISGRITRADIPGNDDDLVALFPTKRSGVEFLKENNAWAFVRIGRNPKFVAMYVSEDLQQVKYVARVKEIVPPEEAILARSLDAYYEHASEDAQAGFDPAKKVVVFEEGSLHELEDPIPFEGAHPQSLTYISLGEFKQAEITNDLF